MPLRSFFSCVLLFVSSSASALVAPELKWKTLITDHFEVIYEPHQKIMAEEFARSAERAHSLLIPIFKEPRGKTVIWINDQTDSPNGMATPFPRNTIIVYPVLPSALDSIGHYDSWSQKLIIHEYAHILNMEPALGFWKPFRFVFGSIVRPNALLPTWYLEGLAVEVETHFSKYGRLRSPLYSAMIRALVEDGLWYKDSLAMANEILVPRWPYGMRPYFYGGLIMHEISNQKGIESLGLLNDRYAARVPFFLSGPAKDLLGLNYQMLYSDMKNDYERRAKEQITNIRSNDKLEKSLASKRWSELGGDVHGFTMSADGLKFAFVRVNTDRDAEIRLVTRSDTSQNFDFNSSKVIFSGKRITRLSFWPDAKSVVFDAIDSDSVFTSFSDLYRYHIEEKRKERLTTNERAQEPQVDTEGRRITFVKTSGTKTELAVLVKGNNVNLVYAPPPLYRVSYPNFFSEDEILFSERSPDGREVLKIFNLQTKDAKVVLPEFTSAQQPVVSEKGILFSSHKSGVTNLYWSTRSLLAARPVTNSTTAVWTGALDQFRGELVYSQLTGTGNQLHTQTLPVDDFRLPQTKPLVNEPTRSFEEPTIRTEMTEEDYSPMSYLLPQYWLPLFGAVQDGWAVSVFTGAQDPLRKHAYFLAGHYDSLTGRVGFDGKYDLSAGDGVASLMGGIDHRYYYAYNVTATNSYTDAQYTLFPDRSNKNWVVGARGSRLTTEVPDVRLYEYAGPGAFVSYSNISQKATDITPRKGIAAGVDYQYFLGGWGNVDFPRTRVNFTTYESRIFPNRHALALNLEGYFSPRNRSVFLGTTAGGNYSLTFLQAKTQFVRGYPVSEFLGWNVASGSLEYRFPVSDSNSELGTFPVMLRRWHGAVFVDAVTLEGYYYAKDIQRARTTGMGSFFYGGGVEARSDITLAYHIPAMIRLGLFYGFNENAYGGIGPFVSLSVPEF